MQTQLQEATRRDWQIEGTRYSRFTEAFLRSQLAKRTSGEVKQTSIKETGTLSLR